MKALPSARSRRGFTMVELAAAMLVMMVALGALSASIVHSLRLGVVNRETAQMLARVRELEAQVSALPFRELVQTFNADPLDNPGGALGLFGERFTFPDRQPFAGQFADLEKGTLLVEVRMPVVGGVLREDADLPEFGFPRDLDGDGEIDGADHSADYIIFPVALDLDWSGVTGTRSFTLDLLLRGGS